MISSNSTFRKRTIQVSTEIKSKKKKKYSPTDTRTSTLPLPLDILKLIFNQYLSWGSPESYHCALVCKQFRQVVNSHPMTAFIHTIIKLARPIIYDPKQMPNEFTFPSFSILESDDFAKGYEFINREDVSSVGFRRLLLQNLELDKHPQLLSFIKYCLNRMVWYVEETAKYACDPSIKKIAKNTHLVFELLKKGPDDWTEDLFEKIDWDSIALEAHEIRLSPLSTKKVTTSKISSFALKLIGKLPEYPYKLPFRLIFFAATRGDSTKTYELRSLIFDDEKGNKEIAVQFMQINGLALMYFSAEMKREKKIAMIAIKNNPYASYSLDKTLVEDPAIVLEGSKKNISIFLNAPKKLKNNVEFILELMKFNKHIYGYLTPEMQKNPLIENASWIAPKRLYRKFIPEVRSNIDRRNDYRISKEEMLSLVSEDGLEIQTAPTRLREDRDIVLAAVKQNGYALNAISRFFLRDKEIVEAAKYQIAFN